MMTKSQEDRAIACQNVRYIADKEYEILQVSVTRRIQTSRRPFNEIRRTVYSEDMQVPREGPSSLTCLRHTDPNSVKRRPLTVTLSG